tara:strand:+ start:1774 stop:2961 length:1188 start_codon:yes stop_codon:yes gene_type:complete
MSERIAISVNNVSKNFKLPHQKVSSIKDIFIRPLQVFRGNKTVEAQHALRNISFDVREGEFFGIVGRNGSGKSTLLKILAEIYQPTRGEVSVRGRLVPFIELGVGFNPELTGRENVYLSGALNGFSEKEIDAMYDDIVEFAELEAFMDQKLRNYSSGMQVRLAFSVATRSEADVLLIDEVLAVGDADFQRKCFDYFKKLKKDKQTVVFVTHDMTAVREYCDRAILMNDSRTVFVGDPDKVADEYLKILLPKNSSSSNKANTIPKEGAKITNQNLVLKNNKYHMDFTIESLGAKNVIAGFKVSDAAGRALFGTNSRIMQKSIDLKGGKVKLAWSFDDILHDGLYDIDIVVSNDTLTQVFHKIERAFTVRKASRQRTPYPVYPGITVEIDARSGIDV